MIRRTGIALCLTLAVVEGFGQQVRYYRPSVTTANRRDFSVSYGAVPRRPPTYNYYYYAPQDFGYSLTPTIAPSPSGVAPIVLGPVRPYSDEEYSRLVLSTIGIGVVEPASARLESRTIVQESGVPNAPRYKKVEARVVDILDRGTLLLDTGEELKLRGVRIPSERNANDVMRYYAREAMRVLRSSTSSSPVYVMLDDPLRDVDGTLMGVAYVKDGTELNRLMLTMGFGEMEPRDFTEEQDITPLANAANAARDSKIGIWSISF